MDSEIEPPQREIDKDFMLAVEGTFTIAGRGTVITGTVDTGKVLICIKKQVKLGEEVEIVGIYNKVFKNSVTGIETFKKQLDYAEAGDNVGLLIRGVTRDNVHRG